MINAIFKVIYGIPLWITVKMAKLVQQFITEMLAILAFRALWWIRVLFWIFFLYVLVLLDPLIKPILLEKELQPVGSWMYDFYNRGLTVIMLLGIAAYTTANLRRRFRRTNLEVRFLRQGRELMAAGGIGTGSSGSGESSDDKPKSKKPTSKPTGAFKDTVIKVFQGMRSSQQHKDTYKPINTEKLDPENTDLSMEQYLAAVGASAQTEVDAMVAGKPVSHARTTPWNLGLGKKSRKSAAELEEEAEEKLRQAKANTRNVRGKYRNRRGEEEDLFGD